MKSNQKGTVHDQKPGLPITRRPSQKQVAANRRNSLKGGVKTEAGKRASSMNSLVHGLTADAILLPWEDKQEFETLRREFMADADPQSFDESILADLIFGKWWKLLRSLRFDAEATTHLYERNPAGSIDQETGRVPNDLTRLGANMLLAFKNSRGLNNMSRYQQRLETILIKAISEYREGRQRGLRKSR